LIDIDELMMAVKDGQLSLETAVQAMHTAVTAIDGLASNGYHLDRWLATRGLVLTWRGA
jgi:predicted RNA-binding protein associated with RNAse of E/G family